MNNTENFADLMSSMLKDKEKVCSFLLGAIEQSNKMEAGFKKAYLDFENNSTDANLKKMLATTMKCVGKQSSQIKALAMIALVYSSGSNYDMDVAGIMLKLGKGQEAMQTIWKKKMRL